MYWRRMDNISWTDQVKMKRYYNESRRRGMSCKKHKEGTLAGLLTFA
jgi:hypothetical protein